MKAENRHHTLKWKLRRLHKLGDKCSNAKCHVCHAEKVLKIPDVQTKKQNEKDENQIAQPG